MAHEQHRRSPSGPARRWPGRLCVTIAAAVVVATLPAGLATAQQAPGSTTTTTTSTADGPLSDQVVAQIGAIQAEKASRTPAERKVDSNLLYAYNEQTTGVAVAGAPQLTSTIEPSAAGTVTVDVDATVDDRLLALIGSLGGTVVNANPRWDAVRAELPVRSLLGLAGDDAVRAIRPADKPLANRAAGGDGPILNAVGAGLSEADVTHAADTARSAYGVTGAGVKVCVLSNGVSSLAARQATGDLPAVSVLSGQGGSGDEGTAMLELIHDIAPGASLGFATGSAGVAQTATNIVALRAAGCAVLVDDVTYPSEPTFQDGPIAQAITQVRNDGAVYFSAVGNGGNLADGTSGTWQGDFQDGGPSQSPLQLGLRLHGWGAGVGYNTITKTGGPLNLQWADPLGGSSNDYDLYLLNSTGLAITASSTNVQNGSQDPYESLGSSPAGSRVVVTKPTAAAARYLVLYTNQGGLTYATAGGGRGHNVSVDAFSVGATPAADPYQGTGPSGPYPGTFDGTSVSETFSADGPYRQFFTPAGVALTPGNFSSTGGVSRNGPDITAADGVTTTTPGYTRFYGTSAAAPNAAAIAALALEAVPSATPAQIESAMGATAVDIETAGFDATTGAGIVMAPAMLANLGVAAKSHLIADTRSVTPQTGDGDAYLEPGETATITQKLRNDGAATASGITATLTSDSPNATVLQDAVAYANIAPGASAAPNTLPLKISVASGCPCGTSLPFTLTVSYNGGSAPTEVIPLKIPVGQITNATDYSYAGAPVAIPDNDPNGAIASISVPTSSIVSGATLSIDGSACTTTAGATTVGIDHTFVHDLRLVLISPSGTQVVLVDRTGADGNNFCQTVFSDAASTSIQGLSASDAPFTGSFQPFSPLSAFIGEDAQGTWKLKAIDTGVSDTGSIRAFTLHLTGYSCNAVNFAPVANGDNYATGQGHALVVAAPGVLGNDTDANNDALTAQLQATPSHGSVTLSPNGGFTYSPSGSFHGYDLFTYKAYDGHALSVAGTVTVAVNGTPVTAGESYVTPRATALNVAAPGVLGNDTDPESDPMTAVVVTPPSHGSFSLNADGSFSYTPTPGYSGADSFTYRATDGTTQSSPQSVDLTVNDPPVATGDSYQATAGQALHVAAPGVLANDTDTEGDALSAQLGTTTAHGSLTLNADGSFTYTATAGYDGPDSFTYRALDATGQSALATASFTVIDTNLSPTANPDSYTTSKNTALVVAAPGVLGNDTDPESSPLSASKTTNPSHGTVSLGSDGSFTYTPTTGYVGADSFTYKASDGAKQSAAQTVSITVNAPPTAVADAYQVTSGQTLNVAAPGVLGNDSDPESDPMAVQLGATASHGSLTLHADGSFSYTPTGAYTGGDSFTYRAKDAYGQSSLVTVSITVNAANVAPTANPDSYTTSKNTALVVAAPGVLGNDSDPESSPLSASKTTNPSHGTVSLGSDGSFTYTPTTGYVGADSFTYKASDGDKQSAAQTVSITVNAPPTAVADAYSATTGQTLDVVAPGVLGNDTDAEGDALSAQLGATTSHGSLTLHADGSFSYTPTGAYTGGDSFTYRAKDAYGQSSLVTVSITVNAANVAPTANPDSYSTPYGTALVVAAPGVLGNDTDPESSPLSAAKVAGPAHGTLTLGANGSFTYTPAGGYSGGDSFTYQASDGLADSAVQTVSITVEPNPNTAPSASDDAYRIVSGRTLTVAAPGVLANDSDPESDPLTAAKVTNPGHGTATVNADGSISYTPAGGFTGTDSFTYRVSDGSLSSPAATVSISVLSPTEAFVDAVYRDFLTRISEPGGRAYWSGRLDRGVETRYSFVLKMSRSHEYGVKVVTRAYHDVLDRDTDPSGREFWANRVQRGMPIADLVLNLIASNEFLRHTGGTVAGFVDAIYQAILDRAPTSSERTAAVNAINGGSKRLAVVTDLYASVESRRRRVRVQYLDLLGRQPSTPELDWWTALLASRSDIDLAIAIGAGDEYYANAQDL